MDGKLFAGRFEIEGLLGTGGMGSVYLARHVVLRRQFAVKVLTGDTISETAMARFRREARAASRVHHRNVTAMVDFGHTAEGKPYLVMEYAEGLNLTQLLAESGRLPLRRALHVLCQVADALAAAHATGVVHRDLKSDNVVLTCEDGKDVVKILDFGLAMIASEKTRVSLKGEVIGTPAYMAPEQCLGEQVDHRTDIYSFGALAFELLVGRPPFVGSLMEQVTATIRATPDTVSAASNRKDIPAELDRLVARCLAKKPQDRHPNATLLSQQLRLLLRACAHAKEERAGGGDGIGGDGIDDDERTSAEPLGEVTVSGVIDWANPDWTDAAEWTRTEAEWTRAEVTATEATENRRLEDLAFAVRDHGLGSPAVSEALAAMLQAEDEAFRLQSEIQLLESLLAGVENAGRERELRLGQALSQLEHEREGLGEEQRASIEGTIAELAGQIGRIQQGGHAQRKQLKRHIARMWRRQAASQHRVALKRAQLAAQLKQIEPAELERVTPSPLEVLEVFSAQVSEQADGVGWVEERTFHGTLQLAGLGAEVPAAPPVPSHLKKEIKRVDATTSSIRLSGVIDEHCELPRLADEISARTTVIIDPSEVQRITSSGVRDWIAWLGRLRDKGCDCYFVELPPSLIAQAGDVEGFLAGGQIVSFWAPYYCPSCDTDAVLLIGNDTSLAEPYEAPVCTCDRCDYTVMEFDDIESSYFAFLGQSARAEVDEELAAKLAQVCRSSAGDLVLVARLNARDAVSGEVKPPKPEEDAGKPALAPIRKSRLKVTIEQMAGTTVQVRLSGVVDEYNELGDALGQIPEETATVLLETSDVQRINSCGVRDWISLLKALDERGCRYFLLDCAPAIMTQVRLVPGFLVNGEIVSFFAPYFCSSCEADKMLRINVEQALSQEGFKAPDCRCDECNNPMEFDDIESSYFAFLQGSELPEVTETLATTFQRLARPSQDVVLPIPTIQSDPTDPGAQDTGARDIGDRGAGTSTMPLPVPPPTGSAKGVDPETTVDPETGVDPAELTDDEGPTTADSPAAARRSPVTRPPLPQPAARPPAPRPALPDAPSTPRRAAPPLASPRALLLLYAAVGLLLCAVVVLSFALISR